MIARRLVNVFCALAYPGLMQLQAEVERHVCWSMLYLILILLCSCHWQVAGHL